MKNFLLTICLILMSSFSFSQLTDPVYNDEWYESLDEKINFVVFPNPLPNDNRILQFRIYRGFKDFYTVYVTDISGTVLFNQDLNREDELDLTSLKPGIYFIRSLDDDGNQISKKIILK